MDLRKRNSTATHITADQDYLLCKSREVERTPANLPEHITSGAPQLDVRLCVVLQGMSGVPKLEQCRGLGGM
jgi:hypothetical protein